MNQLFSLFCFILIFNISYSLKLPTLDEYTIYEYLVSIMKGLSISEEYQCENLLLEKKDFFLTLFRDFIAEVKGGKDFKTLIVPYGLKTFSIPDLISKCQLLPFLDLLNKVSTKEGIKAIGSSMYYNAQAIHDLIVKLRDDKNKGKLLELIGQLLSVILDLNVK